MIVVLALAATFNLVCTGTRTIHEPGEDRRTEPFVETYRINLDASRWCKGICAETRAVAYQDAKNIILEAFFPAGISASRSITIDRETGVFHLDIGSASETGSCEPKPYTGLPARRF